MIDQLVLFSDIVWTIWETQWIYISKAMIAANHVQFAYAYPYTYMYYELDCDKKKY